MLEADSACGRCQICSSMGEVFISLPAISPRHSQPLNISFQFLYEPFKPPSQAKPLEAI